MSIEAGSGIYVPKGSYWACDETGTFTIVADTLGQAHMDSDLFVGADPEHTSIAAGDANTVRIASWDVVGNSLPYTPLVKKVRDPEGYDFIMMVACKQREDVAFGDDFRVGGPSFYLGGGVDADNWASPSIRLQPYFAVYTPGYLSSEVDLSDQLGTPLYEDQVHRVAGESHVAAAVKRGNMLEHYHSGTFTGSIDRRTNQTIYGSTYKPVSDSDWNNITFDWHNLNCSHSGYGELLQYGAWTPDPVTNTASVLEYPQDYYFFYYQIFESGAPSDVAEQMNIMLANAMNGIKEIPSHWLGRL